MTKEQQTENANYKQEDFESIKRFLPSNYIKVIREKIKNAVSERMIQYVLAGKCADSHGIVNIALTMAAKEKKKREALAEKIKQL